MNLSDQTCSFELSKRLKELDIKQESLYAYVLSEFGIINGEQYENMIITTYNDLLSSPHTYAAFTVSELLTLLPHAITAPEGQPYNTFRFRMEKGVWCKDSNIPLNFTIFYSTNYYCTTTSEQMDWLFTPLAKNFNDENPANALAKLLIYLKEKNLWS
jgi:hypothetical protein